MSIREFNTAGPSVANDHYCLDPIGRINIDVIIPFIESKRYFVLHAPRQTGKTTCLLALMKYLNAEGTYRAVYANIENAQTARNDVAVGLRTVCSTLSASIRRHLGDTSIEEQWVKIFDERGANDALRCLL
jgi:hypothetical protein